jgi:hypothetical protein
MEADISIWRKTGHFYFALTPRKSLPAVRVLDATVVLWVECADGHAWTDGVDDTGTD